MDTSEQKKLHIILIEDNPNYRKVLREALDDSEYVTIGNDFGNCERALKYLASATTKKDKQTQHH